MFDHLNSIHSTGGIKDDDRLLDKRYKVLSFQKWALCRAQFDWQEVVILQKQMDGNNLAK